MYESKDKMVSHPSHYQSETGLEVIDVIEAFTFDLKGIEATDTGNIIKYICRWKQKNGLQDLEKAKWYLDHLIDHVSKLKEENEETTDNEVESDGYFSTLITDDNDLVVYYFENKVKAEDFIKKCKTALDRHGFITLYYIRTIAGDCNILSQRDAEIGFKTLDFKDIRVEKSKYGWSLLFPKIEYLNRKENY